MADTSTPGTITQQATRSVKWSALMEAVSRTASPIVTVILARLLTPADFGIVATAMLSISFAQMFWDAGLSKALVQTNEAPAEAAHIVFWTNLLLGLAIYAALFAAAPWVAVFFDSPGSSSVLRVLGLQIVIASLSSVQQALFVRDMDFRRLLGIRLFTAFVPGAFSVPMAFFGFGVWALVAGTLAGQILNLVLLWRCSPWRPAFRYDRRIATKLFGFGLWLLAESLGGWLLVRGDSLIVGRFLGVHDLGVYTLGWTLVTIVFGLVMNPFLPVLYPAFSRLQNDLPALKETFHKVNRIILSVALPVGIGMLVIGPELAEALFGSKWQGMGLVLQLTGLTFAVSWLTGLNSEIYRAIGRANASAVLMYVLLLYYLPAYYFAAQKGLVTFVYVRLAVACLALPLNVYLCWRTLRVSPLYLWHDGAVFFISASVMGGGLAAVKWGITMTPLTLPPLAALVVLVCLGAAVYTAALWLLDRRFVVRTVRLVRHAAAA